MTDNVTYKKAFFFALEIINLYKYLISEKKEYVISKQVLRSATSIGANMKEGLAAQSKRDFLNKMNISLKEACETEYWLEILRAADYIDDNISIQLLNKCKEICRMLTATVKTTKKNLNIAD